jgi:hypothetical protein
MFQALEYISGDGKLAPFPKLRPLVLGLEMDVLYPAVMGICRFLIDMFLEYNDVGIRNLDGILCRQQRRSALMYSASADGRCR